MTTPPSRPPIGGKMGVGYRKLLPPGMEYQMARDFEMPDQPSRRVKKKYKAWMQQARLVVCCVVGLGIRGWG